MYSSEKEKCLILNDHEQWRFQLCNKYFKLKIPLMQLTRFFT